MFSHERLLNYFLETVFVDLIILIELNIDLRF